MRKWIIIMALVVAFVGCQKKPNGDKKSPLSDSDIVEHPVHRPVPEAIKAAFIFKHKEDGAYRAAFRRGAAAAAAEIGTVTPEFHEPAQPTVAAQREILEKQRVRGTHIMVLEAVDPFLITPAVKQIRNQELQVITFEADCDLEKSRRFVFVSPVPTVATGKLLADLASRGIRGEGEIAIVSSFRLAAQQKRWVEIIGESLTANYPKLKLAETIFTDDDSARAKAVTLEMLKARPNLKAIVVLSRYVLPAVAAAVEEAKAQSRVAVVGLGTPATARDFVKRGTVRYLITWNPEDFGYFCTHIARMVMNRQIASNQQHTIGRIGLVVMDDDELPMCEPLVVTADTVDAYDF